MTLSILNFQGAFISAKKLVYPKTSHALVIRLDLVLCYWSHKIVSDLSLRPIDCVYPTNAFLFYLSGKIQEDEDLLEEIEDMIKHRKKDHLSPVKRGKPHTLSTHSRIKVIKWMKERYGHCYNLHFFCLLSP